MPDGFIARRPVVPRDAARLLVVGDGHEDKRFCDLPEWLRDGDVLVLNDTRVIPSRLAGRREADRGTAKVEVTLLQEIRGAGEIGQWAVQWHALARPAKRLRSGDTLDLGNGLAAEVVSRGDGGEVVLGFAAQRDALLSVLEVQGSMPIPPYLGRKADVRDHRDYQTVFARRPGAVAAPTAALHLTQELMLRFEARGVTLVYVTLHVGAGTFRPVTATDTDAHEMEAEWGEVSPFAAAEINRCRTGGGHVIALGTTSLRLLESAVGGDGTLEPFSGDTDLFITPGYRFRAADTLITNFHLPRSTLFMLVCAFAGRERMLAAYEHAMAEGYRFYSYGDACLLSHGAGT